MRADTARNAALRGEQDAGIRTADPRYRVNSPQNRYGIERAGPDGRLFVFAKRPLRLGARQGLSAEIDRAVAELFLDAEEPVVLGHPLRP